ncbi:MAG TPA: Hpt domain-containing protein [Steroidobacteraceae bacterium]
MRLSGRRPSDQPSNAAPADDTFEQVQFEFYERLRKDRATLADLGIALQACGANRELVLKELGTFVHRLQGAAAIFGAHEIREAARALEAAAYASRNVPDGATLQPVSSALTHLLTVLSGAIRSTAQGRSP